MQTSGLSESELRQTVRSVSLGTVWRLLRYPFVLLSAVVVPALMGDRLYGQYAYFMAIYVSLDVLTDVGITQTFGRFLPEKSRQPREEVAHFLHLMLFYGALMTVAVLVFVVLPLKISGRVAFAPEWWLVLCLLLLLTKVEGTIFAYLYGLNQIGRYSAKEFLRSAATFVFVVVLYRLAGFRGALWALVVNECVLLIAALAWAREALVMPWRSLRLREFRPLFWFGFQFYIPLLLFTQIQRLGPVLIKTASGSFEQAGYFDVANQFLQLTGTFLGLLVSTLLPSASALHSRGDLETVHRWHQTILTYCGVVVSLAAMALAAVGRPLIARFLGADYAPVYPNAVVLCLAMPALVLCYAGMNFALLEKRSRVFVWGSLAGLAFLGATGLWLVKSLAALGASWATVGAYAIVAATFALAYRHFFFRRLAGFLAALAVGAALVAPLLLLEPAGIPAALGLCAGLVAVYMLALMLLRIVKISDARSFLSAVRGREKNEGGAL
jgi:O-antigen/teichoic acid export membrane protein